MNDNWPLLAIPILMIFIVIGMLVLISKMLSVFGWSHLSNRYQAQIVPPPTARMISGQSLGFGKVIAVASYTRCITGWVDDHGVFLKPTSLFKLFHPMIFLGWKDVETVEEKAALGMKRVEFTMAGVKKHMVTDGMLGQELLEHGQRVWPTGRY